MKQLPDALRMVTVVLEVLRKRDGVRHGRAKVAAEVPDPNRVGTESGQERRAGGVADSLLAVGPAEEQAAIRQPVDVWCLNDFITIAAE